MIYLPILFRVDSLALGQSYDCPSAGESTLNNTGKHNWYTLTTNTTCKPLNIFWMYHNFTIIYTVIVCSHHCPNLWGLSFQIIWFPRLFLVLLWSPLCAWQKPPMAARTLFSSNITWSMFYEISHRGRVTHISLVQNQIWLPKFWLPILVSFM